MKVIGGAFVCPGLAWLAAGAGRPAQLLLCQVHASVGPCLIHMIWCVVREIRKVSSLSKRAINMADFELVAIVIINQQTNQSMEIPPPEDRAECVDSLRSKQHPP